MTTRPAFPTSFPNEVETDFLKLILCDESTFPSLYERWSQMTNFDDIDYATLRLLPLLYLRLVRSGIRSPIFGRIEGVYKQTWVNNQRLLGALQEVANMCQSAGIPMLVLKGVPLLVLAYKNPGARFLGDVDILIHERDIKKLMTLLSGRGWHNVSALFPNADYFSEASLARITKEATFRRDVDGLEVDVHWSLYDTTGTERDQIDTPFDRLWADAVPFESRGLEYRSMSTEDTLLHIMVHGAYANEQRTLRWVVDSVILARSLPVDWSRFIKLVQSSSFAIEVCVALSFLEQHRFLNLPEDVRRFVSSYRFEAWDLRRYHAQSNRRFVLSGFVFKVWRIYWRYEGKEPFLRKVWFFPEYLAHSRGLGNVTNLVGFIMKMSFSVISKSVSSLWRWRRR